MKKKYIFYGVSFVIPFLLYLIYNINHFYDHGAYLMDDGWFAYLSTSSFSVPMKNPNVFGGTFFNIHISPFFYLLSFIYQYIEPFVSEVVFFSIYLAIIYALLSFAIFNIGAVFIQKDTLKQYSFILLIAIITSFNGVMLSAIGFPHIELAIPILSLLFLSLYYTGKIKTSIAVMFILLLIREDAGLHLFAILFLLQIVQFVRTKQFDKNIIKIALFSITYAVIVILFQKLYFHSNTLERVYLGDPHFAHLTFYFLKERVSWILQHKPFLVYPFLFSILLSIYFKNIYLILSNISILPWILLSTIAISVEAGTFSNYYAFPFILLVSWPTFAFAFQYMCTKKINYKQYIVAILLITVLSIVLFPQSSGSKDMKPWKSFGIEFISNISNTDKLIRYISKNKNILEKLYVDDHVAALMTKDLIPEKTWMGWNIKPSKYDNTDIRYLIFWKLPNTNKIKTIIASHNLHFLYRIPNSKIRIAAYKPIENLDFLVKDSE